MAARTRDDDVHEDAREFHHRIERLAAPTLAPVGPAPERRMGSIVVSRWATAPTQVGKVRRLLTFSSG